MAVPWEIDGPEKEIKGVARGQTHAMVQCRPPEEFSFGPRALKDALISCDLALKKLYASAFTLSERLFLSEAYNPHRTLFSTLLIHSAFDWLLSCPEAPEDFETFHTSLQLRKQSLARKHIYLQPIGRRAGLESLGLLGAWLSGRAPT